MACQTENPISTRPASSIRRNGTIRPNSIAAVPALAKMLFLIFADMALLFDKQARATVEGQYSRAAVVRESRTTGELHRPGYELRAARGIAGAVRKNHQLRGEVYHAGQVEHGPALKVVRVADGRSPVSEEHKARRRAARRSTQCDACAIADGYGGVVGAGAARQYDRAAATGHEH